MTKDPYSSLYRTSSKEVDLRKELHDFMNGSIFEEQKSRLGLLRKMKRDGNGNPIKCACRSSLTEEPDQGDFCRYCYGHGYYWTEEIVRFYHNQSSFGKASDGKPFGRQFEYDKDFFYFEYSKEITNIDYIILVKLDRDGQVITPVKREEFFKVIAVDNYRSDNSRVEFVRVKATEERKWRPYHESHR